MSEVQVWDVMIWSNHIRDNDGLRRLIESMHPGDRVRLRVDGFVGDWEKVSDHKTGHALRPIGPAYDAWHKLFNDHRKVWVSVLTTDAE